MTTTDPYFHLRMITLVNINVFSLNLLCALILKRYALGSLIGKFCQLMFVFSFLDDNFTKYQWIFTKLSVCIDVVDICFGLLMVEFHLFCDRVICSQHISI